MGEFLFFAILIVVVFVALARRGNNRAFGDDSDRKGCRDCNACLRPLVQRLLINATWGNIRAPFVAFISTCPSCGHAQDRHGKRDDGSYLD